MAGVPSAHRQGRLAPQPGSPGCSLASPVLCSLRVTDTPFLFGNFHLASWASPLLPFLKEAVLSQKCSLAGDRQKAHRPAVLLQGKSSSRLPVGAPGTSKTARSSPPEAGSPAFPSLYLQGECPSELTSFSLLCGGQYFLKGDAHTSLSRH